MCSGQAKADRIVLDTGNKLSKSTVGKILKKTPLKPHRSAYWCIPPKQNSEFVARMEDILDIYTRPYDSKKPVICMDEKPYQLLDECREPIPMKPDRFCMTRTIVLLISNS